MPNIGKVQTGGVDKLAIAPQKTRGLCVAIANLVPNFSTYCQRLLERLAAFCTACFKG
jgi:hypothetical protein